MWFIAVEVEQETSAPPPKKNPGSAPEADSVGKVIRRPESETQLAKPVKLRDSSTSCLTEYLKFFPSVALVGCRSCLLTGGFCDRLSVLSDLVERHCPVTFARCFSPSMVSIGGNIPPRPAGSHRSFRIQLSLFTPIACALSQLQSF